MIIDLSSPFDPEEVPIEWWQERMRNRRDALLAQSDWTQALDDPTGNAAAWATYRQALRDFPSTWVPSEIAEFPEPPNP